MNNTLNYYENNAKAFIENTQDADMSITQDKFLELIDRGGRILDFGCGSGRDTKHFISKGYEVTATDGSGVLCERASTYTGIPVKQMLFQDLDEVAVYDGIWACASILHLPKEDLKAVMEKMNRAIKGGGVIYTSFKYGDFEGERGGRYYTDLTEDSFCALIEDIPGIKVEEWWITGDVRVGRSAERWLNLILRKSVTP